MASTPLSPVLRYIRKIVDGPSSDLVADSQLLGRFVSHQNEAAFTALVERHGPMVMGICRRILCNCHDAEDAFQATFLVLVRRARDIREPDRLANWLYGVAYRTATKAKADAVRRQAREDQAVDQRANAREDQDLWYDLRPILDEEINLLPAKYRIPVVLCYLQGKTNEEAARHLGWPRGTVATRLARARERLRHKLTRRGIALSTAVMATTLSQATASGALPATVANDTVQAALLVAANQGVTAGVVANQIAALTEGVLKAMILTKLKTVAVVVLMVGIGSIGAGAVTYRWKTAGPTDIKPIVPTQVAHTWKARSVQFDGDLAIHVEEEPLTIIPPAIALPPVPTEPRKENVHTPNFQVEAPTPEIALKVGQTAERHRKELSLLWLGKELPRWKDPCRIQVSISPHGSRGATSFSFAEGKVSSQIMNLGGPLEIILANTLPHEMTHVILAHSFGRQSPRWADEGAAIMAETDKERNRHETYLRQNLSRVIPLRKLMPMSDYPPEVSVLFAEGFSLTRFLVESGDRKKFLSFVDQGMSEGWDKVVKTHYSYQNVEELEKAWLAHQQVRDRAAVGFGVVAGADARRSAPAAKEVATAPAGYVIEPPDILLVEYARPDAADPVKIAGQRLVRPDGTIGLGQLGAVMVSGQTTEGARRAIAEHLARRLDGFDPKKLAVEVFASNSKVIYVITGGKGGEQVYRLPARDGDTVLDALAAARGTLVGIGRKSVYVARPSAGGDNQVLPVDWSAITGEGDMTTNYCLKPGDRVYVQDPDLPKAGGRIGTDLPALKSRDLRSP